MFRYFTVGEINYSFEVITSIDPRFDVTSATMVTRVLFTFGGMSLILVRVLSRFVAEDTVLFVSREAEVGCKFFFFYDSYELM